MEIIFEQLYKKFCVDFSYYLLSPPGTEQHATTSLFVQPFGREIKNCQISSLENSFPLQDKLIQEVFRQPPECTNCSTNSKCEAEDCKKFAEYKKTESHSFLVLGNSGQGKTSLALSLAKYYWDLVPRLDSGFKIPETTVLPVYIPFPFVSENLGQIIPTFLSKRGIDANAYSEIQDWRNVLLILDAYNERAGKEPCNIWEQNRWGNRYHVGIKAVFFSRPECFSSPEDRRQLFKYSKANQPGKFLNAREFLIEASTVVNIKSYVSSFVRFLARIPAVALRDAPDNFFSMAKLHIQTAKGLRWENNENEYLNWLGLHSDHLSPLPHLQELAKTQFLLTLILVMLPAMVDEAEGVTGDQDSSTDLARICSTEVGLYDKFIKLWFEFQAAKIRETQMPKELYVISDHLVDYFEVYAQNLATVAINSCSGYLNENYKLAKSETLVPNLAEPIHSQKLRELRETDSKHKEIFVSRDYVQTESQKANLEHLRNACLLNFYNDQNSAFGFYRFMHISILEYFISREIFQGLRAHLNYFVQGTTAAPSDSIGFCYKPIATQSNANLGILSKLVDRAKIDVEFSNLLLKVVKESASVSSIKQMSANAMTILCWAGKSLSGEDLRNVQIPGANLSNSILGNVDLRGANLEGVRLEQSWLVGAKLQGSNLKNVSLDQNVLAPPIFEKRYNCYNLVTYGKYFFCGVGTFIVQREFESGKVVQTYQVEKDDPDEEDFVGIRKISFIVAENKLITWNPDRIRFSTWDIVSGKATSTMREKELILATTLMTPGIARIGSDSDPENSENFGSGEMSEVRVFPSQDPSSPHYKSRWDLTELSKCLIRILPGIPNLIIVIVYLVEVDVADNTVYIYRNKESLCFSYPESSRPTPSVSLKFPILDDYVCCDLNPQTDRFLLFTKTKIELFCIKSGQLLLTVSICPRTTVTGSRSLDWDLGSWADVRFCSDGAVFAAFSADYGNGQDSSNHLFLLVLVDHNEIIDMRVKIESAVAPDALTFSQNGELLATSHKTSNSVVREINIWRCVRRQPTSEFEIMLLRQILDGNVDWYSWQTSVPFTFCGHDTTFAYYASNGSGEINITNIGNDNEFANFGSSLEKSAQESQVPFQGGKFLFGSNMKTCVSRNGDFAAHLYSYFHHNERIEPISKADIHVYALNSIGGRQRRRRLIVEHEHIYKGYRNPLNYCLQNIGFHSSSNLLMVVDDSPAVFLLNVLNCTAQNCVVAKIDWNKFEVPRHKYFTSCFERTKDNCAAADRLWLLQKRSDSGVDLGYSIYSLSCWVSRSNGDFDSLFEPKSFRVDLQKGEEESPVKMFYGIDIAEDTHWVLFRNQLKVNFWSTMTTSTSGAEIKDLAFVPDPSISPSSYLASETCVQDAKFCAKIGDQQQQQKVIVCANRQFFILSLSADKVTTMRTIGFNAKPFRQLLYASAAGVGSRLCVLNANFDWFVLTDSTCALNFRSATSGKLVLGLNVWYPVSGCKILAPGATAETGTGTCELLIWGYYNDEINFSKLEINRNKIWKCVWSYGQPRFFAGEGCDISRSYSLGESSHEIFKNFGVGGSRLINSSSALEEARQYIPFADIFRSYIVGEKCAEAMSPIVQTGSQDGGQFSIMKNMWVLSLVIKKDLVKSTKAAMAPHMWLIIEGIRNCSRFILRADKRIIDRQVVITLKPMDDFDKFKSFAKSCQANQCSITESEGLRILRSIQEDQQRDDLQYNLYKKNCVHWCRSKLKLIQRNVGKRRFFDLVVTPSALLSAPLTRVN